MQIGIALGAPDVSKARRSAFDHRRRSDAPPFWHFRHCLFDMASSRHKSHTVENLAVDFRLGLQALQRVAVALEFKSVQFAVDNSYVDSDRAVPNPHFLYNARVWVVGVL